MFIGSFMHLRLFVFLFFVAWSFSVYSQKKLTPAQKRFADSVSKAMTGQSDSMKYQLLTTLFNKNKAKSYNRAVIVGKRGLPYVKKLGTLEELAILYRDLAKLECQFGEENAAVPYFRESARIYKSLNQPATQASVYEDFVKCSAGKGDFKTAYRYELMSRKIRDSIYQGIESRKYNDLLLKYEHENKKDDSLIAKQNEQINALSTNSQLSAEYNRNLMLIIGSALGVFFLLWVIYFAGRRKFKTRLLKERALRQAEKKERLHISKDVHEVLGNELVKIHSLSQDVAERSTTKEIRGQAVTIGAITSHLLETTKDLVWQLNLENSSLAALVEKIREFSVEYLEPTAIELVGKYPEAVPDVSIQKVSFRNIFMVVKEAFSNIVNHSRAMNVSLTVAIANERLHITIKDDGLGFDRMYEKGEGIERMESRMRAIGGLVNIHSELNHGTSVTIDIGVIQIQRK
jgi:signal transduction histidine kinase